MATSSWLSPETHRRRQAAGRPLSAEKVALAEATAPAEHTDGRATDWPLVIMLGVAAVIVALALSFVS